VIDVEVVVDEDVAEPYDRRQAFAEIAGNDTEFPRATRADA